MARRVPALFTATLVALLAMPTAGLAARSVPLALVIPQPGLRPVAYRQFVMELESRGVETILIELPFGPDDLVERVLPAARTRHAGRPVVLVGHGYGGRAVLDGADLSATCGVVLLGTPLVVRPSPWHQTLPDPAAHPDGLDLNEARTAQHGPGLWPLTRLRSPYPASWLGRLTSDWLSYLVDSLDTPVLLPPEADVWIGVAPLDELAPPESLGPALPTNTVVHRWGMLHGWKADATAPDLLTNPRVTANLARWIHKTCS